MDDMCAIVFSWLDTDGYQDEVSRGLTCARSDCAVSGVLIRIVLHVLPHQSATNALNSGSVGNVLDTWLEQHFRATDHNNIVTV